jgi:predicted permease
MLDLATKVNVSLQAVAQLLVVTGSGSWLAKRHGLNKQAIGAVASVNWHAFIPALLFSSILGAIDSQRLSTLWPLLVFAVLHAAIGASASLALGLLARLPRYGRYYANQSPRLVTVSSNGFHAGTYCSSQ